MEEPRGRKAYGQAPPAAQVLESVRFIEPGDPDGAPCEMPLFVYDERHALISAKLRTE
ncbi:hypothetical protein [Polaromonas sp.]|uniref:hypothetical protein n=1 Tax=Polaromonas sp. TaxID=1869339 RepID=UPI0032661DC7